ncbi:TM0106 family RecB-like putative nuclease [Microbacterium sp. P03]|uniref:TM0106 family RecB-like putative nuclease n=1 Tax=Microbacterium sp. P03 TaxID=3366946 RepID=UPI003745762E
MRYIPEAGRVVFSASDLKAAAECEFAWLRLLDARLGRTERVDEPDDAMLKRAISLGFRHEGRRLAAYRETFGERVVEIAEVSSADAPQVAAAVAATNAALASPEVEVVYQAAFAHDDFIGFADFLVRDGERRWMVQDTKLARRAKVTALMQLAAYVDQLDRLDVPRSDRVELILGDGSISSHAVDDLLPVFHLRRRRLRRLISERDVPAGETGGIVAWGDERYTACGRCATCEIEVERHRDLLLVAGMRPTQRQKLREAGVRTIEALAGAHEPPESLRADAFERLRLQARLQLDSAVDAVPLFQVLTPEALAAIPTPSEGDLFFDFEGDPLYTEPDDGRAGLDYLFGWIDVRERYDFLWADGFAEERDALLRFLGFVAERRRQHPDLHIFHYAPYEPTHLAAMAARYGVGEADVDTLLRDGVFVDLYPIVTRALRVGSRSYSIKKLEPLYMGDDNRDDMAVAAGGDSIEEYVRARVAHDDGDLETFEEIRRELLDYNRYDCVSTLRLRDFLRGLAAEHGIAPSSTDDEPGAEAYRASPLAEELSAAARVMAEGREAQRRELQEAATRAAGPVEASVLAAHIAALEEPTGDETAVRLAGAAIDYHRRERKSFWGAHFLRLREPVSVWENVRDVIVVDPDRSEVRRAWSQEDRERTPHRHVALRGDVAPGTKLSASGEPFLIYALPAPFDVPVSPRWIHVARAAKVVDTVEDGVVVDETLKGGEEWLDLPIAIAPGSPPPPRAQEPAVEEWATALLEALPDLPRDPATDILRRIPPRTRSGELPGVQGDDYRSAVVAAVLDLDDSYLAVQGPPGTGKTYVGAHVIAALVREHGFRIGVVAQSHAVVENILDKIVTDGGLPPERVRKKPQRPDEEHAFLDFPPGGIVAFTHGAEGGYVVGGTAWTFSDPTRVPRRSLDLLVIDEAGQYSLAPTIASSVSARNLLLLGDPQQLPQVSQGIHPEPVDTSALGWVLGEHAVIPADRGYFLAQTRRMHPDVAQPVSVLSYEGQLAAHEATELRHLEGVTSGLHLEPVIPPEPTTSSSPAEADRVVRIVRDLLHHDRREPDAAADGRPWTDVDLDTGELREPRALAPHDIIVVTPYNAQLALIEDSLAAVGLADVRVGTVDRFQGQEAAVAILSLAASSAAGAPRGLEFVLMRNRLNVAISRAKYAAYVVYSPDLLEDLPYTPEGVARLSAFARLVGDVE